MEKSIIADTFNTPQMHLESDETHRKARLSFLKSHIGKLELICRNLDPNTGLSSEEVELLNSVEIYDCTDPFKVTNILVTMLENAIEEQRILEGKDLA